MGCLPSGKLHSCRYTDLIFWDVAGTIFTSNVNHFRHFLDIANVGESFLKTH